MSNNTQLVTFNLDKKKHARFKVKAFLEHTDITAVLTKAVDAFIGKIEENKEEETEEYKKSIEEPQIHNRFEKHQTFFKSTKKKKL